MSAKQKGNAGEREVASLLQVWWAQIDPRAQFARVPCSGGWGGRNVAIREGFRASGDVMCTDARFPFTVEIKRRESGWSWNNFLAGKRCAVWQWWRQACKEAD